MIVSDIDKLMAKIERLRAATMGIDQAYFRLDEVEQLIFDISTLQSNLKDANRALEMFKDTPSMVEMQVALAEIGIDCVFGRDKKGQLKAAKVEVAHEPVGSN